MSEPRTPGPAPSRGGGASLSRRAALGAGAASVAAAAVALPAASAQAAVARPFPDAPRTFVRRRGSEFFLDGAPWRFAGTNCYYLHQNSHYMIDSILNDAVKMGLKVIRAWAFADGTEKSSNPLQPSPGVYDEAAFDSLDYSVYKAGQLGLRLVLPLVNNWPDYGGMQQYVQWFLALPDDSYAEAVNHDRFYTEPAIQDAYRAWVRHVVTRENRYTGTRYNADPTIMTWELANEPRCRSDKSGATLLAWADTMSRYVKRQAPRQLVAVGDEGHLGEAGNADYPYSDYEGVRWPDLIRLPAVDYATVHCYPDGWKGELSVPERRDWGVRWISDHVAGAQAASKPVVLEEFGFEELEERDETYAAWTAAVEAGPGASSQFWILTARQDDGELYPDYDGYRVVYPSPTAALLSAHAARMEG